MIFKCDMCLTDITVTPPIDHLCWIYVGQEVHVVLPPCVVSAIDTSFPSDTYQEFKLPSLH